MQTNFRETPFSYKSKPLLLTPSQDFISYEVSRLLSYKDNKTILVFPNGIQCIINSLWDAESRKFATVEIKVTDLSTKTELLLNQDPTDLRNLKKVDELMDNIPPQFEFGTYVIDLMIPTQTTLLVPLVYYKHFQKTSHTESILPRSSYFKNA